jgi:hypothetical protein
MWPNANTILFWARVFPNFLLLTTLIAFGFIVFKAQSEVFNKFIPFKALVDNLSNHHIQRLMTDNGGEYVNNDFQEFCTSHGI